jgi:hypothetical protein
MWFENLNIMKMIGQVENCNQIRKHDCQRPLLKCPQNEYRLSLSSCLNVLHASAVPVRHSTIIVIFDKSKQKQSKVN